jgi:hypothetical protein
VDGSVYVGYSGTGVFTQSGGTHTVLDTLTLAANPGSSGTYNLQGGSLQAANVLINSGGVINQTGGSLTATAGLTNQGTYTMAGGTLSGATLTNNATFSGYGTITTTTGAGFNNYGTMTLTGGASLVSGDFTNQSSGFLYITTNPATFTGNVVNNGYLKVQGAFPGDESIFIRLGTFTNNGTYSTDPATQVFDNLIVGTAGSFEGGAGDKFVISGDFINHSTRNLAWNTVQSDLVFTNVPAGSLNHLLSLPGADLGQTRAGYTNNFAWGSLDLTKQTLTLADGNLTPGGAFYVGSILGVTLEGGKVTDIFGNGLDIYYNSDLAANAYLDGLTYELMGGGYLAPVADGFQALNRDLLTGRAMAVQTPLPASVWLFLSGLLGLGLLRGRKFRGLKQN